NRPRGCPARRSRGSHLSGRLVVVLFFFSSRRRHTRSKRDWSSDVCSSDLDEGIYSTTVTITDDAPGTASGVAVGTATVSENDTRSEERRVGKECRCGRARQDEKKKTVEMVTNAVV